MPRRQKNPLRPLTAEERAELTALSHAQSAPAIEVTRATLLLLVSGGQAYQCAADTVGRKSGDAVAHLVARFNTDGLAAVTPRHGGGRVSIDDADARNRILREARRTPTPQHDGTATWSLTLLRKALRTAPDGLPRVSTYTIWRVRHDAKFTFQRTRTWCPTGQAIRKRKAGVVTVTDPETESKKK
ncbi:helix-turn-helix domain-containing protein [Fimbriiglobus ruber]|uniref:helix-turn-helix domain-containing protein n=1 Tax=Fimbriiglobus ruber TaxID=1908690 RepID=UPI00117B74FB|nr:helix-turn-helix domain-containing protein [Fimbriiglobus ruber]